MLPHPSHLNVMKKLLLAFAAVAILSGCSPAPIEYPIEFEPNRVHAMKYQIQQGVSMSEASQDAYWIVDRFFGTPDEPKIPEVLADPDFEGLISQENLEIAGPTRAAVEASSSATSMPTNSSEAPSSAAPKSINQGRPSASTRRFASRRSR